GSLDVFTHGAGRWIAARRIEGERAIDDGANLWADGGGNGAQGRRRMLRHFDEELGLRGALVHMAFCQDSKHRRADGEDVGPPVDLATSDLFGRHIRCGPEHRAGACPNIGAALFHLSYPEVEDFDTA